MLKKIRDYLRRYPALAAGVVVAAVNLLVHLFPALPAVDVADLVASVLALGLGVEVHRRVTPVVPALRAVTKAGADWKVSEAFGPEPAE